MEAERRLVVDANILIRAVLGPRARNIIDANAGRTAGVPTWTTDRVELFLNNTA